MNRSFYILLLLLSAGLIKGHDLEPRLTAMAPTGLNFAAASYAYSNGNILTDVALPVDDLEATIHSIGVAYVRTFKLFGRLNKFDAVASYNFAKWNLDAYEEDTSTTRIGFGDPFLRWSIILVGGPALTPGEFANATLKKFRLGFGIRVRVPIGQYDPERALNIGLNRWMVKLSLGSAYQLKKMLFELKFATWFYAPNYDFYGGNVIRQQPIFSLQTHWSYVFRPGLWLALSFDIYGGGELSLNGGEYKNIIENTRAGVALAIPIAKQHAIKVALNLGTSARFGANFTTLAIAYQFMWTKK